MEEKMRKNVPFILKDQSGVVLVIALIMIIVLTLLGLASTFTSTFEIKMSGNKRGATDAFYAADSGVQVVKARIENFDLPGKYVGNKYDPFTDSSNPNPTKAKVVIHYIPDQFGAPRGSGFSASGNYDFAYYLIESTGQDQVAMENLKATCLIQEKVVRLVPKGE